MKKMHMAAGLALLVSNVSFGALIAKFDGTQVVVTNGEKVVRWINQTGFEDAKALGSGGDPRPTAVQLQNAGGDTYTVLNFDGVYNHLNMGSDTNHYDGNTFTWIVAFKNGDTNQNGKGVLASTYQYTYGTTTSGNNPVWQTFVNSGNNIYVAARSSTGGFAGRSTGPGTSDEWHVMSGKWDGSGRLYAWLDGNYLGKSSSATADPTGHVRTRIGANSNGTAGAFFKGQIAEIQIYDENLPDSDRVVIENEMMQKYSTLSDAAPYDSWTSTYDLSGTNADMEANPDGDAANNLAEYALGGNPTNSSDIGNLPYSEMVADGGTNWLQFVYYMRNDAASRGLTYTPQAATNLVVGNWTTNGVSTVGVGSFNSGFDSVTSRVSTVSKNAQFMNLLMQFQE